MAAAFRSIPFVLLPTMRTFTRPSSAIRIVNNPRLTRSIAGSYRLSSLSTSGSPRDLFSVLQSLAEKLDTRELRPQEGTRTSSKTETRQRQQELASELCREYQTLPSMKLPLSSDCCRSEILQFLASDCTPQESQVLKASQAFVESSSCRDPADNNHPSSMMSSKALTNLRRLTTPQYETIFQFLLTVNSLEGLSFLMALREDLMLASQWLKSVPVHDNRSVQFRELDKYIRNTFKLWFSPGMLDTRRITYENTSASIIEIIATKEAVHPLKSLDDLRNRLSAGRKRVFSVFHKLMPNQPLVFVHVSLESEVPSTMSQVMDGPSQIKEPSVAVFYSISNGHRGLAGVGLGEFLLKEAVKLLSEEFRTIDAFITLSPLPQFRKWLETKVKQSDKNSSFYDDTLLDHESFDALIKSGLIDGQGKTEKNRVLYRLLEALDDPALLVEHHDILRPIVSKLMARYLVLEKHRNKPLDPVARFHVGNGAEVWRLNYAADLSRNGMRNSFGGMVNYRYNLDSLVDNQRNHELAHLVPVHHQVSRWVELNSHL